MGGRLELVEAPGAFGAAFSVSLPPSAETLSPERPAVLWVGERGDQLEALQPQVDCRVATGDESHLRELVLANGDGAVVLAVSSARAQQLCSTVPALETHAVRAGGFPRPGVLCLRSPFAAGSLRALTRHAHD